MDDGVESFDLAVTGDHVVSDPELDLDSSGHRAPAAACTQLKTCVTSAKRPMAECEESSQKKEQKESDNATLKSGTAISTKQALRGKLTAVPPHGFE